MRRIAFVVIVAAFAATLPAAAPTSAAAAFTFYGSGNGHGLGMSQWGAYGLAKQGWSYRDILTHFYQGTRVQHGVAYPKRLRVGIAYGLETVHLEARGGEVRLWLGAPRGRLIGGIPDGARWAVRAAPDGYGIRDETGALVGGHRWGGPSTDVYATYRDSRARVFIPEADEIYGDGFEYNRGIVEFNLYDCSTGCTERLIVPLPLEGYLYGLGEVPGGWPSAATRAQAVAARTYAAYALKRYGLRSYCNCDLTDGAGDQVYIAYDREGGVNGNLWVDAVDTTADQVVTYQGGLIQAFYASSDGGHSENVEDAWHGGDNAYAIPWLTGVCDPGESTPANPWTDWSRTFSAGEVTSRLHLGVGVVEDFGQVERGVSGRVIRALVTGATGSTWISGSDLRSRLGLRDDRVWINADRNILGPIREKYDSLNCKPGLPTSSLVQLAHGARMRFGGSGLFHNAQAGVTVWLRGAIFSEYSAVGGAGGALGLPTSEVAALRCPSCRRASFEGGRIYSRAGAGTHALWGRVLDAYLGVGGASGRLGFPTSRVLEVSPGTWSATFQRGAISCPPSGACSVG